MEFKTYRLKNGIRLIHSQVKSNVAHLGVFVNSGSRDELIHEHGMAHFIEHAIFKGTKHRKAYHIISRLDDVGGDLNAYTTKEETVIHASFLKTYYARTFDLMSDILFNSIFPEKEIEKEKEVILDEINSTFDNPAEQIYDDFEEILFRNHSMGRSILGKADIIKGFTSNDIKTFIQNNYHTDQIVLSSVGNIRPEKALALAEHYFGNAPSHFRDKKREPLIQQTAVTKKQIIQTTQTHYIIGCPAYDLYHPQRLTLILLNNLLGGPGMNSRLNLTLRERNALTYSTESGYTPYSDTGVFSVYFALDNEDLPRAISLVMREFELLRKTKLGTLQLHKAKRQLIGQLAISAESNENIMMSIGKSHLAYEQIDTLKEINAKIEAISATQMLETANEILAPENLSTLIFHG